MFLTKLKLFKQLKPNGTMIVNRDDFYSKFFDKYKNVIYFVISKKICNFAISTIHNRKARLQHKCNPGMEVLKRDEIRTYTTTIVTSKTIKNNLVTIVFLSMNIHSIKIIFTTCWPI